MPLIYLFAILLAGIGALAVIGLFSLWQHYRLMGALKKFQRICNDKNEVG